VRPAVFAALTTPGRVFSSVITVATREGGFSPATRNYMFVDGILANSGVRTVVSCHWSNSGSGMTDVAVHTTLETFIDPSIIIPGTITDSASSPASTIVHLVDLALVDYEQNCSPLFGNNLTPPPMLTTGQAIGVIPFEWVRNRGVWTGTNVSSLMIRQAL